MTDRRLVCFVLLTSLGWSSSVVGQKFHFQDRVVEPPTRDILDVDQWRQVDRSIEKGLEYLISQQQSDGSFKSISRGQPAITSLCVMSFLANGHLPDDGKYGSRLRKAIEVVCSMQTESGILAVLHPPGQTIQRKGYSHHVGKAVAYNHAIASLMLCEVYGMVGEEDGLIETEVIKRSLDASLKMQRWPRPRAVDKGGWRYMHSQLAESDLSLTGWQVMFLRSAKNAGFDVPSKSIEQATEYVLRCYRPDFGTFNYYIKGTEDRRSRGMAGAGILALAHAGMHNRPEAKAAGEWVLQNGFENYNDVMKFNQTRWFNDCYHYGVFYCCQGMYQLGGEMWESFFPKTSRVLIENQLDDGSWPACNSEGRPYGKCYSTALCVLGLSAPNQLLPVFHR